MTLHLKHRAALAETAYQKLRMVWNSWHQYREKLKIFQSVFISTLIFGPDALFLQDKHLKRIDACYIRFLRRIVGIKASYYSRITDVEVYRSAGEPRKPTHTLHKLQPKMLQHIYTTSMSDPIHHVVFCSGIGFLGPYVVYAEIGRSLRRLRVAPMRAERQERARHYQKPQMGSPDSVSSLTAFRTDLFELDRLEWSRHLWKCRVLGVYGLGILRLRILEGLEIPGLRAFRF